MLFANFCYVLSYRAQYLLIVTDKKLQKIESYGLTIAPT